MNISIVTNSLGGGGAERAMNLLANELVSRGIFVTLLPINLGVDDLITIQSRVVSLNRDIDSGAISTLRILLNFRREVIQIKPDIVILNCDLPELFGLFLPKRIHLIVVEHANPAWTMRQRLGRFVRKVHFLRGTYFVAVSAHLRIWPTRTPPKAVTLNILPQSDLMMERISSTNKILRLVYIGRLAAIQKRPRWLIEISHKVGIPVLFVGAGEEFNNLVQEACEKGVSAEFSGHKLDPWDLVADGDLVIVPSLFEGDGLVVVEAIARRRPLILSDIQDFRRFDLRECHYASSIEEFVSSILKENNNLSNFIAKESDRDRILDGRSASMVGDTWVQIFQDLRGIN